MRLIEPLGLMSDAPMELPRAAGRMAFAVARLIEGGNERVVPVADIPPDWHAELEHLTRPHAPWAGLAMDRPAIMGIVNVTPDSFSDGGAHADPARAIASGMAMAAAGADIIDVGGESTRPGAASVSAEQEQTRILPVVRALAAAGHRVSVDTRNATTMAAALDAGATIINDISALTHDPLALPLVAARGAPVVLMHMRGEPATMQSHAVYMNVTVEVLAELLALVERAVAAGIPRHRIVIDPGIGFAKTAEHNMVLLRRLSLLLNIGCPILAGLSRKSFIGKLSGVEEPSRRLPGSIAAGLHAISHGATLVRVHDVAETRQALRVWTALS
jgi:dihydropteroate synthase